MVHQLFVILGATLGIVPVSRFVGIALRPWINGNNVILRRKVINLLLPYVSRHRPSRDKDDCPAFTGFEEVNLYTIAGGEVVALRRGRECQLRAEKETEKHAK